MTPAMLRLLMRRGKGGKGVVALTDVQLGAALGDLASRGWALVDSQVAAAQVADAARDAGQTVQISKAVKGWRVEILRKTEKPE